MTISTSPLMPDPLIQCMGTGRKATGQEHLEIAERIWTDGAAGRSASGWGRLPRDSRDRLNALRNALLALNGEDNRDCTAGKEEPKKQGSEEFETGQSARYSDKSAKVTRQTGKAFGLQRPSRRAQLALSSFAEQFDRDNLQSRFLTAPKTSEDRPEVALNERSAPRLENFLAIEPVSNRILASATVAIEQKTQIAKAVLVIRPNSEKTTIRWRLLDRVARFATKSGVRMLEAIETRREQGSLNLECHVGWSAAPYGVDPTLMILRKTLRFHTT